MLVSLPLHSASVNRQSYSGVRRLVLDLPISPGIGIGPIKLGMSKLQARSTIEDQGFPLESSYDELDYFCEAAIQLEYKSEHVRFIGISQHSEISCTFNGVDVFDLSAVDLFNLVSANEPRSPQEQPGDTCYFPHQGINLWEADEQYDRKGNYKRAVYAQVGLESPADA